jgi:hypothetical protein
MTEKWNVGILGMKSGNRSILQNFESTFYNDARQPSIFSLFRMRYATITRKSMHYIRFDSLNPPFHYPMTQYSSIPLFHHSPADERSELTYSTHAHPLVPLF